jgi:hypothetical protein
MGLREQMYCVKVSVISGLSERVECNNVLMVIRRAYTSTEP